MLTLKTKLTLEVIGNQLIYSYNAIDDRVDVEYELGRAYSMWRYDAFINVVSTLSKEQITYLVDYLKDEDETVYLEIQSLVTQYSCQQDKNKFNRFRIRVIDSIISYIKGLIKYPKITKQVEEKVAIYEGEING